MVTLTSKETTPQRYPPTQERLAYRQIAITPDKDEGFIKIIQRFPLPQFQTSKPPLRSESDFKTTNEKCVKEARTHRNEGPASFDEEVFYEWDKEKFKSGLPLLQHRYFEFFLEVCDDDDSNEATLQRLVMINVLHPYWVAQIKDPDFGMPIFKIITESQWTLLDSNKLKSSIAKDRMSMPRPDLAISFSHNTLSYVKTRSKSQNKLFSNARPAPTNIRDCLSPDSKGSRCFPFLFMEVKKNDATLKTAEYQNLNSASQALLNIYQWMKRAGETKVFFEKIRIFSLNFTAKALTIRVHRAIQTDGGIGFLFEEMVNLPKYTIDQVSPLLMSAKELRTILRRTFQNVTRQEAESQAELEEALRPETSDKRKILGDTAAESKVAKRSRTPTEKSGSLS